MPSVRQVHLHNLRWNMVQNYRVRRRAESAQPLKHDTVHPYKYLTASVPLNIWSCLVHVTGSTLQRPPKLSAGGQRNTLGKARPVWKTTESVACRNALGKVKQLAPRLPHSANRIPATDNTVENTRTINNITSNRLIRQVDLAENKQL